MRHPLTTCGSGAAMFQGDGGGGSTLNVDLFSVGAELDVGSFGASENAGDASSGAIGGSRVLWYAVVAFAAEVAAAMADAAVDASAEGISQSDGALLLLGRVGTNSVGTTIVGWEADWADEADRPRSGDFPRARAALDAGERMFSMRSFLRIDEGVVGRRPRKWRPPRGRGPGDAGTADALGLTTS